MTTHWSDRVSAAEAAKILGPALGVRNATHFLSDNRIGRTSAATIPFERVGGRIYYRLLDIEAFRDRAARRCSTGATTALLRLADVDDVPFVRAKHGTTEPVVEIGWSPGAVTLNRAGAEELVSALNDAISRMGALTTTASP